MCLWVHLCLVGAVDGALPDPNQNPVFYFRITLAARTYTPLHIYSDGEMTLLRLTSCQNQYTSTKTQFVAHRKHLTTLQTEKVNAQF